MEVIQKVTGWVLHYPFPRVFSPECLCLLKKESLRTTSFLPSRIHGRGEPSPNVLARFVGSHGQEQTFGVDATPVPVRWPLTVKVRTNPPVVENERGGFGGPIVHIVDVEPLRLASILPLTAPNTATKINHLHSRSIRAKSCTGSIRLIGTADFLWVQIYGVVFGCQVRLPSMVSAMPAAMQSDHTSR